MKTLALIGILLVGIACVSELASIAKDLHTKNVVAAAEDCIGQTPQ
jgi:hypothetical protein